MKSVLDCNGVFHRNETLRLVDLDNFKEINSALTHKGANDDKCMFVYMKNRFYTTL